MPTRMTFTRRGRPRRRVEGIKLNLFIDPAVKRKLYEMATERHISTSRMVEGLVEAANDGNPHARISVDRRRLRKVHAE